MVQSYMLQVITCTCWYHGINVCLWYKYLIQYSVLVHLVFT